MTTKQLEKPPTRTATVRTVIRVLDRLEEDERVRVVEALQSLYLPQAGVRREA